MPRTKCQVRSMELAASSYSFHMFMQHAVGKQNLISLCGMCRPCEDAQERLLWKDNTRPAPSLLSTIYTAQTQLDILLIFWGEYQAVSWEGHPPR